VGGERLATLAAPIPIGRFLLPAGEPVFEVTRLASSVNVQHRALSPIQESTLGQIRSNVSQKNEDTHQLQSKETT
jgi:hypothetical protein